MYGTKKKSSGYNMGNTTPMNNSNPKPGMHKMPDGTMMQNSEMSNPNKTNFSMPNGSMDNNNNPMNYKHGGVVKANCGASVKPNGKTRT